MEEHEHCSCVDPLLAELARVAREVEAGRRQGRDHRPGGDHSAFVRDANGALVPRFKW